MNGGLSVGLDAGGFDHARPFGDVAPVEHEVGLGSELPRRAAQQELKWTGPALPLSDPLSLNRIPPTDGAILWGGHPLSTEVRRRQALVFQKPVLLRRSVAANLDFVLRGGSIARRRDALLAHVGLAGHADQAARLLSGGEQQRLALARALATDPDVLFLDEPTASLDPASTLKIEEIVLGAAANGTRIVFITHDLGQARRLADDVVFLAKGRVAEYGSAATFFDEPASGPARAYLAGRLVI